MHDTFLNHAAHHQDEAVALAHCFEIANVNGKIRDSRSFVVRQSKENDKGKQ